jgi:protein TonB
LIDLQANQTIRMRFRLEWDALAGLLLVVALHAAALWGLWSHRLLPSPREAMTVFVNFIAPPTPKAEELPVPPRPRPRPVARPQPQQLVAAAPMLAPAEHVVSPPPQPAPVIEAPPAPVPKPVGPVTLDFELSVSCPERTAPGYPPLSRRMGEAGTAVLRVELDEQGQVAIARVATGSGFARLDEAALAAVKSWRCNPAQRNGQPVRAVALQPFKFVLQGN